MGMNRRDFLATTAALPALGLAQTPNMTQTMASHNGAITLGIATYTFRNFSRSYAIKMLKDLGVVNCNVKDMHLPMTDTPEQLRSGVKKFADAGLKIVAGGNVGMQKEEQLRPAFEYAKACGFPVIVCIPTPDTIGKVESLVKEFNIPVAIHNHGPEEKNFQSPYDVLKVIGKMDPRVGLCIDVGHTMRTGVDVVKAIADAGPRLLNMHVKDLKSPTARDSQCEVGKGVLPFPAIFKQLLAMNYKGSVDLEYEINEFAPLEGTRESLSYMRGVLDGMKG
jgi:sugar phosphate isomerase/epimerase